MGGEGGAALTVPAALQTLSQDPSLSLTLVGNQQEIQPMLQAVPAMASRCSIVHAESLVTDADEPRNVLRAGRDSSMYKAVELVQQGDVEAMVSAGNTGALLMIGRHLLKTIPGIQKPAIVATIPGAARQSYLLDVGANPECTAQQLFEFAVMGSVLAESLSGGAVRVGLLNIGAEQYKGTAAVRETAMRLERCQSMNYVGFVEANALFEGNVDVVVCDGFVGNVTIKSSAGVANVVKRLLDEQLARLHASGDMAICVELVDSLTTQINPQRFNGASLLGLQGSIVKSHGNATAEGFAYAIRQAVKEVEREVPTLIATKVAAIMAAA